MQEVDGNQTGNPASVDNPHTAPTGKSTRRAPLEKDQRVLQSERCHARRISRPRSETLIDLIMIQEN